MSEKYNFSTIEGTKKAIINEAKTKYGFTLKEII